MPETPSSQRRPKSARGRPHGTAARSQREHRYERLVAQAREKGMDTGPLSGYLDCFRYGTPPHGGLGPGLGRLLMLALGLPSIREATFLFRGPHRLEP